MLEVGITVYHSRDTLPKALDSLVAQTKKLFITCLSIDGDGEDYSDIINEYEHRGLMFRIINSEENGGPGIARQRILDTTECDYITFLDSDDMLLPRAVEILYGNAKANDYDILKSNFIREKYGAMGNIMDIKNRSCTWFHGSAYKVSYIRDNNIRFMPELRSEEDAYFNVIAYNCTSKKGETNEITYLWRDNQNSITRKGSNKEYFQRSYKSYIYSQVEGLKKIYEINEDINGDLVSQTLINIYNHYMRAKYYKLSLEEIDESISTLKETEWMNIYLNTAKNWVYIVSNIQPGAYLDENAVIFYKETFDLWASRLLRRKDESNSD